MTTREELVEGCRIIVREGLRTTRDFTTDDWNVAVHDEEGGWTRKQIYCHLVATAEATPGLLAGLASAPEGEDAGAGFDIGAFNAQQVAARESMPPAEIMQAFEKSFQGVLQVVQELPEEQLEQRRRFGAVEGTVADILASVLVLHGIAHIYLASTRAFV